MLSGPPSPSPHPTSFLLSLFFSFFSPPPSFLKNDYVHHLPQGTANTNVHPALAHKHNATGHPPWYNLFLCHYSFFLYRRLVVTFISETWIHMPVGSHYFSRWYWYSIITYAYGHYFSGAINMCCDPGALDLTSHTCLLLAEACFKSVTSVFSRTNLVSLPSLTAPPKTRKFHQTSTAHWPSPYWLEDGSHWGTVPLRCPFLEKYGVATENMPFFIFLLLVTRYAWDAVIIAVCAHVFFVFQVQSSTKRNKMNLTSLWTDKAGENLPVPPVIKSNSETLHPMWGLSGFVFFYLRCLCSAISM